MVQARALIRLTWRWHIDLDKHWLITSKDKDGKRYCHVHVCHVGHFQISELLVLCDYLCEHPNEAARYGNLKSHLARQFANDNVEYMRGKDKFIRQLVGKAMEWRGPNKPAALIASSFGEAP